LPAYSVMAEDCCAAAPSRRRSCPDCGERAQSVDTLTVKALLTPEALARFEVAQMRFCTTPSCHVVYFDDEQVFGTADLGVAVWQKSAPGARVVCYCFGENESEMRAEIARTGTSDAVARVRAGIAARRCACEVRNPRGTCCLGDVTQATQALLAEVSSTVPR